MHLRELQPAPADVQRPDVIATSQRRADGPLGVVLVRDGHAEHRHEAIALDLGRRASERFDDPLELEHPGPEEGVHLFGVEAFRERRVARQVGEQDRDELAFARPDDGG